MAKGLDMRIDEFMAYDTAETPDTAERTVLKEWQKIERRQKVKQLSLSIPI